MNEVKKLDHFRINELASGVKVKRAAVETFLGTITSCSVEMEALLNLSKDANDNKWNMQTVSAIKKGIREHFSSLPKKEEIIEENDKKQS